MGFAKIINITAAYFQVKSFDVLFAGELQCNLLIALQLYLYCSFSSAQLHLLILML
jgi:hypothetical protein